MSATAAAGDCGPSYQISMTGCPCRLPIVSPPRAGIRRVPTQPPRLPRPPSGRGATQVVIGNDSTECAGLEHVPRAYPGDPPGSSCPAQRSQVLRRRVGPRGSGRMRQEPLPRAGSMPFATSSTCPARSRCVSFSATPGCSQQAWPVFTTERRRRGQVRWVGVGTPDGTNRVCGSHGMPHAAARWLSAPLDEPITTAGNRRPA